MVTLCVSRPHQLNAQNLFVKTTDKEQLQTSRIPIVIVDPLTNEKTPLPHGPTQYPSEN